jgi:HPt (histidine-containing phosphotransfer) domain-containing protein
MRHIPTTSALDEVVAIATGPGLPDSVGVLDETALLSTVGGDRALAGELAQIFLQELEPRMREIASAIRDGDASRLQFGAHALRGSAASLSATQVAASAGALEEMGRRGQLTDANGVLVRLEAQLEGLSGRLTTMQRSA